jgi:hypothetical protein
MGSPTRRRGSAEGHPRANADPRVGVIFVQCQDKRFVLVDRNPLVERCVSRVFNSDRHWDF